MKLLGPSCFTREVCKVFLRVNINSIQSRAENTRGVKTPVFICNLYFLNAQTRQRWYKIISKSINIQKNYTS